MAGDQAGADFMIRSGILSFLDGALGAPDGDQAGVQDGLPDGAMEVLDLALALDTLTDTDGVTEDFTPHGATTITTIITII